MTALEVLVARYGLALSAARSPITLPQVDRRELARFLHAAGLSRGAEIGVEQGRHAETLCRLNPGLELLCVDAWATVPGYRTHVSPEDLARFYTATQRRLAPYGCDIRRGWSEDVARTVPDASLDFVYVDARHDLPSVIRDLAAWVPKVRPGGIVAGHDYQARADVHVIQAVTAWTSAYGITPWFVLGDPASRRTRSWMWVQPS